MATIREIRSRYIPIGCCLIGSITISGEIIMAKCAEAGCNRQADPDSDICDVCFHKLYPQTTHEIIVDRKTDEKRQKIVTSRNLIDEAIYHRSKPQ